ALPILTPFDEQGNINWEQTTNLVEHLLATGTDGLVVSGTTGESPTLTEDEKIDLFTHFVQIVNKRVPVIAGTGSYNTKASIDLPKKAEDCGVDGIMLVNPYYNKPHQSCLYEHYKAITIETTLSIMTYIIPS